MSGFILHCLFILTSYWVKIYSLTGIKLLIGMMWVQNLTLHHEKFSLAIVMEAYLKFSILFLNQPEKIQYSIAALVYTEC
jgi:chromate transport protein ChrA